MDNKFNINRMFKFTKYLVCNDRRTFILTPLFLFIGIVLINMVSDTFIFTTSARDLWTPQLLTQKGILMVLTAVAVTVMCNYMPSRIQSCVAVRKHFARYMMLPVAESERFASMALLSYIVMPVVLAVLAALAFVVVIGVESSFVQTYDLAGVKSLMFDGEGLADVITSLLMSIASMSLGAYFWHKHAFLKSVAAWFVAYTALILITVSIWHQNANIAEQCNTPAWVFFSAMTVIFGVLSWLAYKKRTVISRTR